jgi:integrase/recombinase XerD
MSPIQLLVARHQQHLETMNVSPCTLRNRAANLRQFLRFLRHRHIRDVAQIDVHILHAYQLWLHRLPTQRGGLRTAATLNRGLATIKVFFRYLYETGSIEKNPARELMYAREPQPLPQPVLSPAEAKHLIEAVEVRTSAGYRDRTILEVFYATGIRQRELINLTLSDLNYEEQLLTVRHGKGGGDRVVPLGTIGTRCVVNYVKVIRPLLLNGTDSARLFVSRRGRPMSATALTALVKHHAAQAGIHKHMTCHLWRHTCATHMVQNGANLRHVQEMLGHHDLTTTERYLHLTILDLKAAHHKHHPREKEVAPRRPQVHNAGHAAENAIPDGSPAKPENRAIMPQSAAASTRPANEIRVSNLLCT